MLVVSKKKWNARLKQYELYRTIRIPGDRKIDPASGAIVKDPKADADGYVTEYRYDVQTTPKTQVTIFSHSANLFD